jgi:uncharacterized protein YecE (DUF72 family)
VVRLIVGMPTLVGDVAKFGARFDMVELHPVDTTTPRAATLRGWRRAVPPSFVFSVVLPAAVGRLEAGTAAASALGSALEVATTVEARCLVLQTPAEIRPTVSNKKRIAQLLESLPHTGVVVCWEPQGIWEPAEVLEVARASGAVPIVDAAREAVPPGSVAYTRLRALGRGAALGQATLERVAERLRGKREAFVVCEAPIGAATRARATLVAAMGRARPGGGSPVVVRPGNAGILLAEDEEQ